MYFFFFKFFKFRFCRVCAQNFFFFFLRPPTPYPIPFPLMRIVLKMIHQNGKKKKFFFFNFIFLNNALKCLNNRNLKIKPKYIHVFCLYMIFFVFELYSFIVKLLLRKSQIIKKIDFF